MARPRKKSIHPINKPEPADYAPAPPPTLGIAEVFKKRKQLLLRVPTFQTEYRFRLIGNNNEVIGQSEAYTQKHNAKEVIDKHFPNFAYRDVTGE